ncbi:MAG TPA: response regulator [Polyangiales bacterium]|nr:response regulator [Polyangiales bacterium]
MTCYTALVDARAEATTDAPPASDAEGLLSRWRERVLGGVIVTSLSMLVPAALIQGWQVQHGVRGAASGFWVVIAIGVALALLAVWRAPYKLRAGVLVGFGFGALCEALFSEGFAPAQCLLICLLVAVSSLLFSLRVAGWVLGACAAAMAIAAWLFGSGLRSAVPSDHIDVAHPLNWLRVGMYTLLASATLAVASAYLIGKLRGTLRARTKLVAQLRAEVAERERALRELERTQAQLVQAQKLEAVGQLAAGIAHDFNNTLSIVSLEADLLARNANGTALKRSTEALQTAAERGKQLTRQLLSFSRPSGPRAQCSIDAARVFEECTAALRRLLPSEITFETDIGVGPLTLDLEPSELHQLVLNLGINARDAMVGGGTLRLSIERRELDEVDAAALGLPPATYVLLRCKDSGSGMTPATLARIFEPFFSTKGPGRGTGLGLTNVWNIAKRAGGHVSVQSTIGSGTLFAVYLPLGAAAPAAVDARAQQAEPLAGNETVLVVEDDVRIRALLVATLADAGYRVLDAPNVDAALALESQHSGPIDVVCTDVVMPGRQARELLAELCARRPQAGILVCSGYSEDEQIDRGIHSGEFRHLSKPFTRSELLTAIRGAIQSRAH